MIMYRDLSGVDLWDAATKAQAEGRGKDVFDWFWEVASMVHALAARARGAQVNIGGHWFAVLPVDSTCHILAMVCDATNPYVHSELELDKDQRAKLAAISTLAGAGPVLDAARTLARAALKHTDRSPSDAADLSRVLISSVLRIAEEFETSPPVRVPTPAEGEPPIQMHAVPLGVEPVLPRPGVEVLAALAHCHHLARGRLVPGDRILHPAMTFLVAERLPE